MAEVRVEEREHYPEWDSFEGRRSKLLDSIGRRKWVRPF